MAIHPDLTPMAFLLGRSFTRLFEQLRASILDTARRVDDVVTQLYTSGTTGLPKGTMISGKNISCILTEADRVFRIGGDTVSLVAMPLFHIGGTGWALCGMSRGGQSGQKLNFKPS